MKYPPVNYHDYLKLDQILNSQKMRSEELGHPCHDEHLFITVHQTYEIWFKQILFEIQSVMDILKQNQIPESQMGLITHRLNRVIETFKLIIGQIDILETMTPLDFLEFRDYLYPASGFQSFQFRILEIKLGLRTEDRMNYLSGPFYQFLTEAQQTQIKQMLQEPSLFELIEKWLIRTPFLQNDHFDFWQQYQNAVEKNFKNEKDIVAQNPRLSEADKLRHLQMQQSTEESFHSLFDPDKYKKLQAEKYFRMDQSALKAALFIQLYRDLPILHQPNRMVMQLLDIDEILTQWRYRHALMAHRMLGKKIGTGGSSGYDYLKKAADKHKIFTDFFNLTTFLLPRSAVPQLPKELSSKMSYTVL